MTQFPSGIDTDLDIIRVDDNITELGGIAIDQCRDAIFAIEGALGTNIAGTAGTLAARIGISLDPNGNLLPSAIASAGLVSLPIVNSQVSSTAGIQESKLALDHRTADLFNMIQNFDLDVGTLLSFLADTGVKVEPHIDGIAYNHTLSAIHVAATPAGNLLNKYGMARNNTNAYTLLSDINNDLNTHETSNGLGTITIPPVNFAHVAAGINLNTSTFNVIPQTATDLQALADFLDSAGIFLLGTRIQTLYSDGVPYSARATSFNDASHGQLIVPTTPATTYLLHGGSSAPVDSITVGDDIVQFNPTSDDGYTFDAKFAQVRIGDIVSINYGSAVVPFIIRETKYIPGGTFVVRFEGKNILASTTATASINRPLFNTDKTGVLALAPAYNVSTNLYPSLIVGSPRAAQVIGTPFVSDQLDASHYNLYLQIYPTGNPADTNGVITLPAIDTTGNKGISPDLYTLDTVVQSVNDAVRKAGFNYRFIAYNYQGQFGLMLADHYDNASFSIISGVVDSSGAYNQTQTNTQFPNNVIDVFTPKDALGLGPNGSGVASPPFTASYPNSTASQLPTFIWPPLKRKNFYVNGVERDSFNVEPFQSIDSYGDGYWSATIDSQIMVPNSNVFKTYKVLFNLSTSSLAIGNTIVVQPELGAGGTSTDFGRFIITDVEFNNCNCDGYTGFTTITVFDAIHGTGISPSVSAPNGTVVRLYYNGSSVGFNKENVSDQTSVSGFARHMEVYVDQNGNTFTQERGRLNASGSNIAINGTTLYCSGTGIKLANLSKISPKLRGYAFGSVRKINLLITSFNATTGIFTGNLRRWDGVIASNQGPTTSGKLGQATRFYDETNVDFIDIVFEQKDNVVTFSNQHVDIQLFPTLSLDQEVMLIGTCQVNDLTKQIRYINDQRQFGNISEKDFSTSAIDFIAASDKLLRENGVIRGFEVISIAGNNIFVNGGVAMVNGKIVQSNATTAAIPAVFENINVPGSTLGTLNPSITWFLCINDSGELVTVASTDFSLNDGYTSTYTGLGLDNTRLFWVQEPISSNIYQVRGTYLADLVLNQKDLVPIAVLLSTTAVSGGAASVSATANDARRFVANGYNGLDQPFTLGTNASFRSMTALLSWLNQLTNFVSASNTSSNPISDTVVVKGHFPITTPATLNFSLPVYFEGDGGIFDISIATGFNLGNNVHFRDLTFNYIYDATSDGYFTSGHLINSTKACLYCDVGAGASLSNHDISVTDCTFIATHANHFPFASFEFNTTGGVLQNLDVLRNNFIAQFASDDVRAAIAFTCTTATGDNNVADRRMVNCHLVNNKCDKNQMFAITSPAPFVSPLGNMLATTNCSVEGNTCGTIGVMVRSDTPSTPFNNSPSATYDKYFGLRILDNTCRYIASLDSNGREWQNTLITANSGDILVRGNICSWIRLVLNLTSGITDDIRATAMISHNLLNAYDFNWRKTNFNLGLALTDNAAIAVLNTGSNYSETWIQSNHIGIGESSTTSPPSNSLTQFNYDTGILAQHNAFITDNIIRGLQAAALAPTNPIGIQLANLQSTVRGNKLYRGAPNTWSSYIDGASGVFTNAKHIITENFFDQSTVDSMGFNFNVIANLSAIAIAHTNVNQTGYLALSLLDYARYITVSGGSAGFSTTGPAAQNISLFSDNTSGVFMTRQNGAFLTSSSSYIQVANSSSATNTLHDISFTLPLDDILPAGVKIVSANLGLWIAQVSGLDVSSDTNNQITLWINAYKPTATTGNPTFGVADVLANTSGGFTDNTISASTSFTTIISTVPSSGSNYQKVLQSATNASTQYCLASTGASAASFVVGNNYRIAVTVDINWKNQASTAISWWLSPIVVTYRW
jgi:hypothetical protein